MNQNPHGYSAEVRIHLIVDRHTLDVARLLGNTITIRTPINHPPGPAELVLKIDDFEQRWAVELPEGLSEHVRTVTLASLLPRPLRGRLSGPAVGSAP